MNKRTRRYQTGDLIDPTTTIMDLHNLEDEYLKLEQKVVHLEDAFIKLFDMLMDKTRPENCYVKEWYVHKEYNELKTIVDSIKDSK